MTVARVRPIEFTEYYAPDGRVLKFDSGTRFLISEVGYGMPPIKYIEQRGPFQHGKTIYDYRLDPRIIQILFRENSCDRNGYWDIRANILNILRPNRQPLSGFELGTLRKILPDGARRDIRVIVEQGPEFKAREVGKWDEWSVMDTIRFIAPDPTFFDPEEQVFAYASEAWPQLIFPFTFDDEIITFPDEVAGVLSSLDIYYTGTWATYPTIVLTGPLTDVVITNSGTGETIDLSAHPIVSGETVTINLEYGYKTVISSVDGNIIGLLSDDSDLVTFHIAPEPESPGGYNNISIQGNGAVTGYSSAEVRFFTRFIGI